MLVGRWVHNLRRRMNKWVVQRMGWSLDIRMMLRRMVLRMRWMLSVMGNNSR